MIDAEKFETFKEYENYVLDVQHFWTLFYEIYPELKQISGKRTAFSYVVIDFVNDYTSLKQQIRALENLKKHNTYEHRVKYLKMIEKICDIKLDFI